MTVPVPDQLEYISDADGVTKDFPYPIRFLEKDELIVALRDAEGVDTPQVLNTHYTIAGSSWPTGGTVSFITAPQAPNKVVRYRMTQAKQTVGLANNQRNDATSVELQLDRLTLALQDRGALSEAALAGVARERQQRVEGDENLQNQVDAAVSLVGQAGPIEVPYYDTVVAVGFAHIKPTVQSIRTGGFELPGDGGAALYKRSNFEPVHAGKVQSADGSWWELSSDIISPKMFGAKLDGLSNDTQALSDLDEFVNLVNPGLINIDGDTSSSTVGPWVSHNQHTPPQMNRPLRVGAKVGSPVSPDPNAGGNPMLWFEKWTSKNQHDPYAHNTEGGHIEINYVGSGEAGNQVQGTPMGFVSSVTTHGRNVGTETAPEYDMRGSPIGLCGFAEAKKSPGPGNIVTAMWAYATTPTMTQAEFDACSDAFSVVGLEVNIMQNMPDVTAFEGKNTVGVSLMNYRWAPDVKDWTNGIRLDGTGIQGDNSSNDLDDYNGFRVGIYMDKLKEYGLRFGYLMEGVGISFPSDYTGMAKRPHISLDTGDTGILFSEYKDGSPPNFLMWQNSGRLYFKQADGYGSEFMLARGTVDPTGSTVSTKIPVQIGGVTYYIHASMTA